MFRKILVANRGEIACRIMRTARRMGIATVAVYSDADADAPHAEMADESVHIGPAPAAESYLKIEAIVEAARRTGAEAVHPGYGFLSENGRFAGALEAAGIVFIGPLAETIRVMGDKIISRRYAQEAGVATVPGHDAAVADAGEAAAIAEKIGWPVMIKAAAGGGGKGMRVARTPGELEEGFARATGEAQSGFGDARVFLEKFIESPRHIEIQILADSHGGVVHLGERECSVQRRHQKVVEESPSPFLDAATREEMSRQAILLAKAVDYRGAGTVEFIVAPDRSFYFLEMNTRLQVEHPVTELVTGLDIVEEMIRVAAGEPLRVKQESVRATGWAIEGRIYAEDPYRGFLPSSGRLVRCRPPPEHCRPESVVRNDTGVREGSVVPVHYDPMIAKLCAWGPDRPAAIRTLLQALDGFRLDGVGHNIPFLSAVLQQERFCSGDISTGFIQEQWPDGFSGVAADESRRVMLESLTVFMDRVVRRRAGQVSGGRGHGVPDEVVVSIDGESRRVRCVEAADHLDVCRLDESGKEESRVRVVSGWRPGLLALEAEVDGVACVVQVDRLAEGWRLSYRGTRVHGVVRTVRGAELAARMPADSGGTESRHLICPMPGLVVMIAVSAGQEVAPGDTLAVVEAMKMENVLRAERPGRVARVLCEAGQSLAVNDIMVEFE